MATETKNDSYQKHHWRKVILSRQTYWKCINCGCKATDDYAEKIGLDKLDIVDPCKMQVRKGGNGS